MSRQGFTRADVDTGLMSDPKVAEVARILRDPTLTSAALLLYVSTVLASWREGRRLTLREGAPLYWLDPPDTLVDALVESGLLDDQRRIPKRAWESWYEPAADRIEDMRERASRAGIASGKARRAKAEQEDEPDAEQVFEQVLNPSQPASRSSQPFQPASRAARATPSDMDGIVDVIHVIEDLTERPFSYGIGSRVWETLAGDVRDVGMDKLVDEYRETKQRANGGLLDGAGLVLGTHNRLYEIPAVERMTAAQRREAEKEDLTRRIREGTFRANDQPSHDRATRHRATPS